VHALLLVGVEEAGWCAVVVTDFEDGGARAGYDGVGGGDGFRGCCGGCYGLFTIPILLALTSFVFEIGTGSEKETAE